MLTYSRDFIDKVDKLELFCFNWPSGKLLKTAREQGSAKGTKRILELFYFNRST